MWQIDCRLLLTSVTMATLCANVNKTYINRVSTTRRSMNQLETLQRNKASRDTDLYEFTGLECNNWIFINLLLILSWSWTLFPPYITWRVHRWMQRTTKASEMSQFSCTHSPYKLHIIVKLGTHSAVFTALVPIPRLDEDCSVQHLRRLAP